MLKVRVPIRRLSDERTNAAAGFRPGVPRRPLRPGGGRALPARPGARGLDLPRPGDRIVRRRRGRRGGRGGGHDRRHDQPRVSFLRPAAWGCLRSCTKVAKLGGVGALVALWRWRSWRCTCRCSSSQGRPRCRSAWGHLRCHTRSVTATTDSLVSKNRWLLAAALFLVVPGTLLSIAFGGIGLVLLLMLLVDFLLAKFTRSSSDRPSLGVAAQLGLAVGVAVAVGGVIALVAVVM